jgi:hypothetical protein
MTFDDLIAKSFMIESNVKHNSLFLLDIDDTLLKAKNIYIYRKLPSDNKEVKLTPEEYAKDPNTKVEGNKKYYDYREFKNPEKVATSIKTGVPIIPNLKMVDNYIKNGWKIGILTARGMEEVIFKSIKAWFKIKDEKGNLEDVGDKLVRDLVFAVNDDNKKYKGDTDFSKKKNVIKRLSKEYERVYFLDDDQKNIDAVNELKKEKNLKNIKAFLAKGV